MERVDLRDNEFVEKFVSSSHIDSKDDQFWYQLLSCSFNFMRVFDPQMVDKTLDPYLVRLTLNNSESHNIGSLVRVFINRVARIKTGNSKSTSPYYIFQSFNALYLLRTICKSYIQNLSEDKLIKSLKAVVDIKRAAPPTQKPQPPPEFALKTPLQQSPQQPVISHPNGTPTEVQSQVSSETIERNDVPATTDESTHQDQQQITTNELVTSQVPPATDSNAKPEYTSGQVMLDNYISTLIAIIVDIPEEDSTYLLKVEAINALVVLLSAQMYSSQPADQLAIYKCLMQKRCSIHALVLTKTLLNNFVAQKPEPQESGSLIIGLASGIWKVLTLGIAAGKTEEEENTMPLLARQSLLLLNILTNHCTSEKNPYREAITSCQDSKYDVTDAESANNDVLASAASSKSVLVSNRIKIDLYRLYETICSNLNNEQVALLLYLLLQSNKIFRPYILTNVANEMDKLLLPLLKILYSQIEKGSHHVYMVLIIFIILSEEPLFNSAIHQIVVHTVPWYKDRILTDITLGSLTTLIMIRSFQFNTFRIRDKFLHTNMFATLANLSNYFRSLHPYVCQRLLDFLERLGKRYLALTKSSGNKLPTGQFDTANMSSPLVRALTTDTQYIEDASSQELDSSNSVNHNNLEAHGKTINISIPSQLPHDPCLTLNQINNNPTTISDSNLANVMAPTTIDTSNNEQLIIGGQQSPASDSASTSANEGSIKISMDNSCQDVDLLAEVIKMLLEIINNCLMMQMGDNPDLIYTLLYKRSVFSSLLSSHQSFYNLVINVERVLTYSYNQIEAFARPLSEAEIKALISSTANNWKFDHERDPNTRLLFHYVEDEQPEDFFVPYIWTRVYYSSGIYWEPRGIQIFNAEDL